MKKNTVMMLLSIFLIFIMNACVQVKFYNFIIEFLFKFLLFFSCFLLVNYFFSVKKDSWIAVKILLCIIAVFILDNPTQKTIDLFNQKDIDYHGVENLENGWLYTSLRKMSKSVIFPIIIDGHFVYILEVTKSKPIFIDGEFDKLSTIEIKNNHDIFYEIIGNEAYFKYDDCDFNYYGYINLAKYSFN